MKRIVFVWAIMVLLASCKTDKKQGDINTEDQENVEKTEETVEEKTFDDQLIDLRKVSGRFAEGYGVDQFGILKMNDSLYAYVFKLLPETTEEMVNTYSVGVKGFEARLDRPFSLTFSPELKEVEGNKYLILANRKLVEMKYFDSLDVYIYARDNWKDSGRLGGFKVRDVLFIDD